MSEVHKGLKRRWIKVVTSVYLGNNQARVGGYSYKESFDNDSHPWNVMADFVDWKEVLKVADENSIKWVHLAGDWSDKGHKGFGERVPISVAKKLVKKYG